MIQDKISKEKIKPIDGIEIAVIEAGIKYENRKDLVLFKICNNANTSSVFTQNKFCAAPVIICKENLKKASPKYLIINTGNANAGTGKIGLQDAQKICDKLASLTNVKPNEILPFSTGVTVEFLPIKPILNNLENLVKNLKKDNWNNAAIGIMTTDTLPKGLSVQFEIDNELITISGITKGSGMIKPNMATMLSFIATDAKISQPYLNEMLEIAVNKSFNRITVDGDTSTNDSCVLIATGKGKEINKKTQDIFTKKLIELMKKLAQDMIRDGEGASKFITVSVKGGCNSQDCLKVAYKIAHSPLVKTALFASDPNVGRIMVAIGNANIKNLDPTKVTIKIAEVLILQNGIDLNYDEAKLKPIMQEEEINIVVDLQMGDCNEIVWTCDLSYDYVKINADYRT